MNSIDRSWYNRGVIAFIRKYPSHIAIFILTLLASFYAYLITLSSGTRYCFSGGCGDFFWGSNTVDGLWHISIMQHSFMSIPFTVPILSGAEMGGYNYLLDLMFAPFQLIGISPVFIYFKLMPVIWVIAFTYILYILAKKMNKSTTYLALQMLFVFFGTGLYFVFALYHHGSILATDGSGSAHTLTNLQFAYSLVGILLVILTLIVQKVSLKRDLILGVLLFFIFGLKFYAGVVAAALIGVCFIHSFLARKISFPQFARAGFITLLGALIAILVIYDPLSQTGTEESVFRLAPFALAHRLIEEPDRFYIPSLALARYTLMESGWGPRLIALEIFAIISYLVIELGIRIIGLLYPLKKIWDRKFTALDSGIYAASLTGIILSLLLVQRGQWWNVIQFLYVSMFVLSFHSAEAVEWVLQRSKKIGIAFVIFIVTIFVPFNLVVARSFAHIPDGVYVPEEEIALHNYVKDLPGDTILRLPLQVAPAGRKGEPLPISHVNDSPFLSVYTHKTNYLGPVEILKILDVEFEDRQRTIVRADIEELKKHVDYVYIYGYDKQGTCNYVREIRSQGKLLKEVGYMKVYEL